MAENPKWQKISGFGGLKTSVEQRVQICFICHLKGHSFEVILENFEVLMKIPWYKWIMKYIQDRKQYITVNGEASESKQIEYGVPHGSLLGPRLYGVHANNLPDS